MVNKYKELGFDFINPAERQERADEEGVDLDEAERDFFGEND